MKTSTDNHTTAFALTCPLLLDEQEQNNPYLFVKDFFDFASLEEYKEELSLWFKSAVSTGIRYENANNLFFMHSQIIQLLNAGFLITKQEHSQNSANASLAYITETVTIETITAIRYGLHEWLFAASSEESDLSGVESEYSFALYELLVKLVEAFHIVLIADTELNRE